MNFRQVNKKIKTVGNVKKITNAMQMVSSVKMRKAQKIALEGREYRDVLTHVLKKVMSDSDVVQSLNLPWLVGTDGDKTLYILITSNKGLCGSFHSNLFKHFFHTVDMKNADFITAGEKGGKFVTLLNGHILADFSQHMPFTSNVSAIFSMIDDAYATGKYKSVVLMYNKFISSMQSDPTSLELLPVGNISDESTDLSSSYTIEPSVEEVLKPLLADYIKEQIRAAMEDSEAAEHSARMMAMKSATDNANDLVHEFTLLRNKLRQAQITNELLDMIAAQESSS